MPGEYSAVRIPEPSVRDDTWGRRGEQPFEWFARSTLPRAMAGREFLNANLAKLPPPAQASIYQGLRVRWQSAFFELIVARTLQLLGASVVAEPEQADGRRPDFAARFSEATILIEAVSPIVDADIGERIKKRNPLLDIIEAAAPPGWRILVNELPDIGPTQSKKVLKRSVQRILDVAPPEHGAGRRKLVHQLPQGSLELTLLPGDPGDNPIWMEPAIATFSDVLERIVHAVDKKRSQVQNAVVPAVLAINAGGFGRADLDEFDVALLGSFVSVVDRNGAIVEVRFDPSGAFGPPKGQQRHPTFAAALAYPEIGFRPCPDPVLYIHPRFDGQLPAPLLELEQRTYDPGAQSISVTPARRTGILEPLGFVVDV